MALVKLLGEKVVKVEGDKTVEVDVSSLAGEGKVVGIYFSAHWCPPCRGFTPKLAEWYRKLTGPEGTIGDKLNIVFASSDRDEKSFLEYFREMPWLALPFVERDRKSDLSKKYKVTGIPTLIFLDALTAKVITKDGRTLVMHEDPEGKNFPWTPKSLHEIIFDGKFVTKSKKEVEPKDIQGKTLGIYFSAHWCGPCREFTPQLVKVYEKLKKEGKEFEIIFVSSDKSEDEFKRYYSTMPWISIPHGDPRKKTLSQMFDVSGIPTLVIVDENGQVINADGRPAVGLDQEGVLFPWHPEPVRKLIALTSADINECPALVWFTEDDKALDVLRPISEARIKKSKEDEDTYQKMVFYVANKTDDDDDIIGPLKKFAGISTEILMILDVNDQKVYKSDATEVTPDILQKFVEGFDASTLESLPIRA